MKYSISLIGILALIFSLVVIGCGEDDDDDEYQVDSCIDDVAWKANECGPSYSAKDYKNNIIGIAKDSDTPNKFIDCLCDISDYYCDQFNANFGICLCRYAPEFFGYHYDDYCD